jgi:iron-sulfur cluster assembly protein
MSEAAQATQNSAPPASAPSAKPTGIAITDKAVKEVRRLKEADPSSKDAILRVQVVGGGCSGMSYKLGFENEAPKPTDKTFEKDGVVVAVDTKSYLFLAGTELDFTDGLNGQGFVFKNPNAKRTCGCGSSFSA